MKFGIISDTHLGHMYGTEQGDDSFSNFEKALQMCFEAGVDLVIHAGDLFDTSIPKPEVLHKCVEIVSSCRHFKKNVDLFGIDKHLDQSMIHGLPFVAIYGTHDRRARQVTAVETLEKAGLLVHLHANGIGVKKDGDEWEIWGLSGVPDMFAKEVINRVNWHPSKNSILVLHQSIKPFIPKDDVLALADLPENFSFYIDGHIHANTVEEFNGKKILLPGSTIITQQKKAEEDEKRVWFFDTKTKTFTSLPLPIRRFFYREIYAEKDSPQEVFEKTLRILDEIFKKNEFKEKPQIHIKIKGSFSKKYSVSELDLSPVYQKYKDTCFLKITKDLEGEQIEISEKQVGIFSEEIFLKNLEDAKFPKKVPYSELWSLLMAEDIEKLKEVLENDNKN